MPATLRRALAVVALALPLAAAAPLAAQCVADAQTLCLLSGRFQVRVHFNNPHGGEGEGQAIPLAEKTGAFWFFDPENYEVIVKVLDGRGLNDRFWVFFGSLTDVEYRMTVVDTMTREEKVYTNVQGHTYGVADTGAFHPPFCGGIAGFPCPSGRVCDLDPGTCGFADQAGTCVPEQALCAPVFAPVCGCDGQTYDNDCLRLRGGAIRAHAGPC